MLGRPHYAALQYAPWPEQQQIFADLDALFASRTMDEWLAFFGEAEVCVGPVLDLAEAYDDPQLRARGMIVETDTPSGPKRYIGPPIKLSDTPAAVRTPPATFGEHTDAVLTGLGLSADAIARLREGGVV
jgi:crotonobetainyl-CoA:carnitine CoA-transferase CaiB-like acyl-CoA transferase